MKNTIRKIFTCSFILFVPLIVFALFLITLYPYKSTDGCIRYYEGRSKDVLWGRGEWHHYVDFLVDVSAPHNRWKITKAPLPSSFWRVYDSSDVLYKRVGYRWPSNWEFPSPASDWQICLLSE